MWALRPALAVVGPGVNRTGRAARAPAAPASRTASGRGPPSGAEGGGDAALCLGGAAAALPLPPSRLTAPNLTAPPCSPRHSSPLAARRYTSSTRHPSRQTETEGGGRQRAAPDTPGAAIPRAETGPRLCFSRPPLQTRPLSVSLNIHAHTTPTRPQRPQPGPKGPRAQGRAIPLRHKGGAATQAEQAHRRGRHTGGAGTRPPLTPAAQRASLTCTTTAASPERFVGMAVSMRHSPVTSPRHVPVTSPRLVPSYHIPASPRHLRMCVAPYSLCAGPAPSAGAGPPLRCRLTACRSRPPWRAAAPQAAADTQILVDGGQRASLTRPFILVKSLPLAPQPRPAPSLLTAQIRPGPGGGGVRHLWRGRTTPRR